MEESFVLGKIALCTLDKVKKIPNLFPKKQRSDPSGNPHALRSFLVLNSISPNSLEKMGDPAGFWTSLTAPPPHLPGSYLLYSSPEANSELSLDTSFQLIPKGSCLHNAFFTQQD